MNTSNKSSTTEPLNQKVGMNNLSGTKTQMKLQYSDNLSDGIQDSTRPGNTGHSEASKTQYEDSSTRQKSDSQHHPEPLQGTTTAIIT